MTVGNIVLIGMPSSGKSTVGQELANKIGFNFVDTDTLILNKVKKPLKDVVNDDGLQKFLKVQESVIMEMNVEKHVIATGGSVIYGEASMNHLKDNSITVYLETEIENLEERLVPGRRFARNENQSFLDMYMERKLLYEKYADITIKCSEKNPEIVADEIFEKIRKTMQL